MSETSTFGGFDALGDLLANPDSDFNNALPNDDTDPGTDPVVAPPGGDDDDGIINPSSLNNEPKNPDEPTEPVDPKDPVTDPQDPVEPTEPQEGDDIFDLGEYEADVAGYVQEKLYERFGWTADENDSKFENIDGIVEFINKVVEDNSKPDFANDELAQLNDFVSNGGNIESYLQQRYDGNVDLEKIDISDSANQNLVLREFFKEQGHDSSKIEKRLQRYEDTGIKEDEAREAYDLLKNSRKEKSEKLLENQRKQQETLVKQQQEFYNNVLSNIEDTKSIRGIPLSAGERKKLAEYIFKSDSDGKTPYQKDYEKSTNNLIESAFFTMKGDALINKMNNQATSNAAKALKQKLETKTKRGRNTSVDDDGALGKGDFSLLTGIGSSLHKPQF